jgi:hypothetical protein
VNLAREKARFKTLIAELLDAFRRRAAAGPPGFIGQAPGGPLEHTTRRYLVDEVLTGLGWDLSRLTREVVEEARVRGSTTLRMDYVGVNPETRTPLLIVETKAWDRPFVSRSSKAGDSQGRTNPSNVMALLAEAIEHFKDAQSIAGSPVIKEWAESIEQLHNYVSLVYLQSDYRVPRVAILAGRWLVVFTSPYDTFVKAGDVSTAAIHIFQDNEILVESDAIYDLLGRASLIDDVPELLAPSQVSNYASNRDVSKIFRALWVVRKRDGAYFAQVPQISLYAAIVIERRDRRLLTVVDSLRPRLPLPHDIGQLGEHFLAMNQSSASLLQAVNTELGGNWQPSSISTFPGFVAPRSIGVQEAVASSVSLLRSWQGPDEFLLVTGEESHYLLPSPTVDPCGGHDWAECYRAQENKLPTAVISRSYGPASFFITKELHHCAHRQIYDRRESRCHIQTFEEFLCCRACTLQSVCWTQAQLSNLPCGKI